MQQQVQIERRTIDVEIQRGVNDCLRTDSRALALKLKNRGSYAAFCSEVLLAWRTLGFAMTLGLLVGVPSGLVWMANSAYTRCSSEESLCYELRYAGHWVAWQVDQLF